MNPGPWGPNKEGSLRASPPRRVKSALASITGAKTKQTETLRSRPARNNLAPGRSGLNAGRRAAAGAGPGCRAPEGRSLRAEPRPPPRHVQAAHKRAWQPRAAPGPLPRARPSSCAAKMAEASGAPGPGGRTRPPTAASGAAAFQPPRSCPQPGGHRLPAAGRGERSGSGRSPNRSMAEVGGGGGLYSRRRRQRWRRRQRGSSGAAAARTPSIT